VDAFISSIEQFHFIRPEWLFALPVALIFWLLLKRKQGAHQWSSYIPKEMLMALQTSSAEQSTWWKWCLLLICIGTVCAAAGPSWDKQSVPTGQNQKALVLVLDLSPSMLAQDLSPDRLTRAKFKLIDMLRQQGDGQTALIAYAGEAHTVSPLSDDPKTIEALLPALHPNVMPVRGSNTEAAVELAQQLLSDAGLRSGDILLITDGIASDAITDIRNSINSNYRVSVLAVGGNDATPIPSPNGGFIRKASGEIVLSAVNPDELRSLARSLGGRFAILTGDDSDIDTLLKSSVIENGFESNTSEDSEQSSVVYDAWVDMGHWLVLFMLPFLLTLFRKGAIYIMPVFICIFLFASNDAYAAGFSWKDLWQTIKQYQDGNYEVAADTFTSKDWSALANYKNGEYEQAISQLSDSDDANSLYNKGNALAFSGQLEEAIDAYDEALEQQPNHQDALHNKSVLEQLLNQQEQNQQQKQNSENSEKSEESSESSSPEQQNQDQNQQQNSQPQQADSQNQQSDQPPSEQEQAEAEAEAEKNDEQQEQPETSAEEQQAEAAEAEDRDTQEESKQSVLQADNTSEPLKDSSEQWLRTIQDDPSGLLRRKFDYQARQRAQQGKRQPKSGVAQDRY